MMPEEIGSPANPRVRAAADLRERRERDRTGRILIDGAREVLRALDAGVTIETIFLCEPLRGCKLPFVGMQRLEQTNSVGTGRA